MKNLLTRNEAERVIMKKKKENKIVVFTNGCFDILHVGHLRYLKEAKELGDVLVVGLNSDDSVRRLKGQKRPYVNEEERAEMLLGLKPIDYVIVFDEDTPIELLEEIKPTIHVKGGDYKKEELPETKIVEENDGIVKILSLSQGKSSTNIIKKITEGEIK